MFSDIRSDIFLVLFLAMQHISSTEIGSGISQAIRESNKISMTKNIFSDNRVATEITAERTSFKRDTAEQPCEFGIEKYILP